MKSLSSYTLAVLAILTLGTTIHNPTSAAPTSTSSVSNSRNGFFVSLQLPSSTNDTTSGLLTESTSSPLASKFIIPDETGPSRWSCTYMSRTITTTTSGTSITIGRRSSGKPYSCGELISREQHLNYGRYSVDMISTSNRGHVSSFFLVAPGGASEIDVELTGIDSTVVWVNIWKSGKQNPVKVPLGFDAAKGWHTYTIEWRKEFVAWYVDGKLIHKRSDVSTLDPQRNLYKLALNSWTHDVNDNWAGRFSMPSGQAKNNVKTQFRNLRYTP
ncbi:hypothetical protein FBU30_007386 [Linnemannia zychae]|nr:hypothetical protein FBU30_007386 [Linnemannia zychae]